MPLLTWLTLVLVCCLGAITPGPSLLMVLKNTLSGSRQHGAITAISHGSGIAFYAAIAATGLDLMIRTNVVLFDGIMALGGLYLLWSAWQTIFRGHSIHHKITTQKSTISYSKAAIDGLAISFLNPKIMLVFIALFSQFVHQAAGTHHVLIIVATAVIIDVSWYLIVACLLSQGPILQWLEKKARWIDQLTALVFIGLTINIVLILFK